MVTDNTIPELATRTGFFRRLGCFFTDAIIVVVLELLVAAVVCAIMWVGRLLGILSSDTQLLTFMGHLAIYQWAVWVSMIGYFIYGWSVRGQTLAMHWFGCRVQNIDGTNITVTQAAIRLFTAAFGLGNFAVLFDPAQRLAFQDHWAKCEVIELNSVAC